MAVLNFPYLCVEFDCKSMCTARAKGITIFDESYSPTTASMASLSTVTEEEEENCPNTGCSNIRGDECFNGDDINSADHNDGRKDTGVGLSDTCNDFGGVCVGIHNNGDAVVNVYTNSCGQQGLRNLSSDNLSQKTKREMENVGTCCHKDESSSSSILMSSGYQCDLLQSINPKRSCTGCSSFVSLLAFLTILSLNVASFITIASAVYGLIVCRHVIIHGGECQNMLRRKVDWWIVLASLLVPTAAILVIVLPNISSRGVSSFTLCRKMVLFLLGSENGEKRFDCLT